MFLHLYKKTDLAVTPWEIVAETIECYTKEDREITQKMAMGLSLLTNTTVDLWQGLEVDYREVMKGKNK